MVTILEQPSPKVEWEVPVPPEVQASAQGWKQMWLFWFMTTDVAVD